MKSKLKVVVLFGGRSSEHDVSIASGKEIVKNLDKTKYLVTSLYISKDGKSLNRITGLKPDVVFIALHGKYGEDGKIQGYLETLGLKYTGSGVFSSAIGMNKIAFRKILQAMSIAIPKYEVINEHNLKLSDNIKPPFFVKPYDGGSSLGVSYVKELGDLKKAIKLSLKFSTEVLVEEYVQGLEVSCGVLGNNKPIALPVIEIHPLKSNFFDYKSKYLDGGSMEIAPARISEKLTQKVQQIATKIYEITGCSGYARVDFILKNNKEPIVLEINTLPGMTSTSLLPKEAKAAGITYSQLLDKIIKYAIKKH